MTPKQQGYAWWAAFACSAFAAMISFFQINSYQADKHHLNGFWLVMGIILTLCSVYSLYRVSKLTDGGDGRNDIENNKDVNDRYN